MGSGYEAVSGGPPEAPFHQGVPATMHQQQQQQLYPLVSAQGHVAIPVGLPVNPMRAVWMPPQPHPDMPIKAPRVMPVPGQVLIYYEISEPEVGCFKCEDLSMLGVLSVILMLFVCWPFAWVPCVITECHRQAQRPVYGFPPADEEQVPMLVPGAAVSFPHHQMLYFPNQQI